MDGAEQEEADDDDDEEEMEEAVVGLMVGESEMLWLKQERERERERERGDPNRDRRSDGRFIELPPSRREGRSKGWDY